MIFLQGGYSQRNYPTSPETQNICKTMMDVQNEDSAQPKSRSPPSITANEI